MKELELLCGILFDNWSTNDSIIESQLKDKAKCPPALIFSSYNIQVPHKHSTHHNANISLPEEWKSIEELPSAQTSQAMQST